MTRPSERTIWSEILDDGQHFDDTMVNIFFLAHLSFDADIARPAEQQISFYKVEITIVNNLRSIKEIIT